MPRRRKKAPKAKGPPRECADCHDPERPPVVLEVTEKQIISRCPICGLLHYVGLPVL